MSIQNLFSLNAIYQIGHLISVIAFKLFKVIHKLITEIQVYTRQPKRSIWYKKSIFLFE